MPPFQQWFLELVSIISDACVSIAAIAAIAGLWQWRRELVGKAKYELAHKIILLALEFRGELKLSRSVFLHPNESSGRFKSVDENPFEALILDEYYARLSRLKPVESILNKLQEASWEAETILSLDDSNLVQPFEEIYNELKVSIFHYFDEKIIQSRAQYIGIDPKKMEEYLSTFKESENDSFSRKVDQVISSLKGKYRRYIK